MPTGYDPDFIGDGIKIELPTFDRSLGQSVLRKPDVLRDGIYSDHIHFTLVMNEHTRQLIYAAQNINQRQFRTKVAGNGKRSWRKDSDIGRDLQLGNEYYKDRKGPDGKTISNPYDKGHMVMRFNNMWGPTDNAADKAGKATFVYANASLQHQNLNRDEWQELELRIVRTFSDDSNDRLTVFTGPIYGDLDRHINLSDQNSARIPSGFFKVICFRSKHDDDAEKLGVLAFAIFQDTKVLRDRRGRATVKTDRSYQVTISELQDLTGINFGRQLFERNPLFYFDHPERNTHFRVPSTPERIPINTVTDVVAEANERRCDIETLSQRRIVIASAMINPKGNEKSGEWVSLHNRGDRRTSVKNWQLVDGQGRKVTLDGSINSGESLRLKGSNKGNIKLPNAGGSLMLFDNHGCVIDHVTWAKHDIRRVDEGIAYLFERGQ
ncbi:MAG: DNA/RNA non-specific endonuclease [Alphaproteobacteria bacterium]|nr:DNA/RNA non-specific endonuclease [Alphaproteobacteria bacterium]